MNLDSLHTQIKRSIQYQELDDIKEWVEKGADIHKVDAGFMCRTKGFNLLHHTLDHGDADILAYFLKGGVDYTVSLKKIGSILDYSVQLSNVEMIKQILALDFSAQEKMAFITKSMMSAIDDNDFKKVSFLLSADGIKYDINLKGRRDNSLMHFACRAGNIDMVKQLCAHGADKTVKNALGLRPIDIAIKGAYDDIVLFLNDGIYPALPTRVLSDEESDKQALHLLECWQEQAIYYSLESLQDFAIAYSDADFLDDWFPESVDSLIKSQFHFFAHTGEGGAYALWHYQGINTSPPVVYFGSGGAYAILSHSLQDFLILMSHGLALRPDSESVWDSNFCVYNVETIQSNFDLASYDEAEAALNSDIKRFGDMVTRRIKVGAIEDTIAAIADAPDFKAFIADILTHKAEHKKRLTRIETVLESIKMLGDSQALEYEDIYLMDAHDEAYAEADIGRIGGDPIGVDVDNWPQYDGKPMHHVMTIELKTAPLLAHKYPNAVAIALFISEPMDNEAYEPASGETYIVLLSEQDIQTRKLMSPLVESRLEKSRLLVQAARIPKGFLKEDILDMQDHSPRYNLYNAIFNVAYMGTGPLWMQGDEYSGDFICQFDNGLLCDELNIAGGIMYMFDDTAFWQCG